ncbi:hypothetical protein LJC58_09675 [Lachnospiraceae bacterium OttesenSCG-928-D06]|nr:hypothetical protein [Lachnospiraceae bacterium OttesenSCG-928-D06]
MAEKTVSKKKICLACTPTDASKLFSNFYISKSPLHQDGRVPWCKECIKKNSLLDTGEIDEDKFKSVLRQLDKPYYKDVLQSVIKQFIRENGYTSKDNVKFHGDKIIGLYFTKLNSLRQLQNKSYGNSESDGFIQKSGLKATDVEIEKTISAKPDKHYSNIDNFIVSDEIKELFGDGYTSVEYKKMYDKYEKLKLNYSLQTNLHQEALATYVRFKVKEEFATAMGNVDEANKWYNAAQNAAEKAKLTPKQLTQSDLQGGINCFSDIFKAVEQAIDVIPILPQFKFRPNDALDFNIWCYINYARDLQGLPQCEYEDVYKFYDRKKNEYLEQYGDPYGIFDEDTSEKNREAIKKFITLPANYGDE